MESTAIVEYFVLATVTRDLTESGRHKSGGTGLFAAAMAHALGRRVGLAARFAADVDLSELAGVAVVRQASNVTTTFENRYSRAGRVQYLHERAPELTLEGVPDAFVRAPIVHLGPLAQDLDPRLALQFPDALLGVTPQGWLRAWDAEGRVRACNWAAPEPVLERADAVVLSFEDVGGDVRQLEQWAERTKLLVVTDAERGADVFHAGARRHFPAPAVVTRDPTGAGDLFAAAYLIEYHAQRDPFAAAARAVWLTSMLLAEREARLPDQRLVQRLLAALPED